MTETVETKTKKARKVQGPRTPKPYHLLIRATDENGDTIQLSKDRVTVEVVTDPGALLELMTSGNMEGAVYKKFTPSVKAAA